MISLTGAVIMLKPNKYLIKLSDFKMVQNPIKSY